MTQPSTVPTAIADAIADAPADGSAETTADAPEWWRTAVIYQIYPRSYADGDGDGMGDLGGIRARLQHIADLGADAIWLSPFYRSPMLDGGYDVADYRAVDPMFGDVADVEELIRQAHRLGLRVLIDIVPNHTSDRHEWFVEAQGSQLPTAAGVAPRTKLQEGPWRRYHCVRGNGEAGTEPPNDWQSTFGGPAWTPIPDGFGKPSGWHYLHLFDASQPDLDWGCPDVIEEFHAILRFWFDRGADGFRIDVAHGLVKAAGYPDAGEAPSHAAHLPQDEENGPDPRWDQPGVHEVFRGWRRVADTYDPPKVFVGEVWVETPRALANYLRPDELHTAFNFDHLKSPWHAATLRRVIDDSRAAHALVGATATWVLENHDVWRARTRYAPVRARDETGDNVVQHRTGDLTAAALDESLLIRDIEVGLSRACAGMLVMLALPGSAYLYQGQELGLFEVLDLPASARQDPVFLRTDGLALGRDGCRVPIPWSGTEPSYGFGAASRSWLPQPDAWADLSVAAQTGVTDSTLRLTRQALQIRREQSALGFGDMTWDTHDLGRKVLSFTRPGRPGVRCVVNMSTDDVALPAAWGLSPLLGSGPAVKLRGYQLVLPVDHAVWLPA